MKTITFYSYKGGVGRSLALANIATRLSEIGKKVCVIDFDLEAPGLHYKFANHIRGKKIEKGIVDYISRYSNEKIVPESILPYVIPFSVKKQYKNEVSFIPAGNLSDSEYWNNLSSINWFDLFYNEQSRGIEFFLDLKYKIEKEIEPDVLLIDSRTGITDISSMTMSILADEVVLIGANNEENKEGLKMVINSLKRQEFPINDKPPKLHIVLSRIPFPKDDVEKRRKVFIQSEFLKNLNDCIRDLGEEHLIKDLSIIHSDRELEMNESFKIDAHIKSVHEEEKDMSFSQIGKDYSDLFDKITKGLLNDIEIKRFEQLKKAEILLIKAEKEDNSFKKVEILNKVIELDETAEKAYYLLGKNYYYGGKYKDAITHFEKAIEIDPDSIDNLLQLGDCFFALKEYEKAKNTYIEALKIDQLNYQANDSLATIYGDLGDFSLSLQYHEKNFQTKFNKHVTYNNYADTLRSDKQFDKALTYINKAIQLSPRFSYAYATLAEINAELGNMDEFYKNIELALVLSYPITNYIYKEDVYKDLLEDKKFLTLLERHGIDINEEELTLDDF